MKIPRDKISVKVLPTGQMQANCYIVSDNATNKAIIIDPGDEGDFIVSTVARIGVVPEMVIATHGHFDHIMAALHVQSVFHIPFMIHADDAFLADRMQETAEHFLGYKTDDPPPQITGHLKSGQTMIVGESKFETLHTPGHTPGSCCFVFAADRLVFTGDTLFADGAVGRYDFSYSNKEKLFASVSQILQSASDTRLLPGHGQETTVQREKRFHEGKIA